MKITRNINFRGFYIFQGRSCANSCLIENLDNAKKFKVYMNFYFKGYLKVYDFFLSKDGWKLAVKLNDKESILEKVGEKFNEHNVDEACWRIISERVRLFLSTFVRVTNKDRGRTGTLVHSNYERKYFNNLSEAIRHLNDMRQQRIKYYRKDSKYAGMEEHYEIGKAGEKGSVFLSSRAGERKRIWVEEAIEVLSLKAITRLVLQNAINNTNHSHKSQNHTKTPTYPIKT